MLEPRRLSRHRSLRLWFDRIPCCEPLEQRLTLTASFAFIFDGPVAITAAPGSLVSIPLLAQIDSTLSDPSEGAIAWSMSIKNENPSDASITGVTSLIPADIESTELTSGAGNEGATTLVLQDYLDPDVDVLPAGVSNILSLMLEGLAPAAGVTEIWTLQFVNGMQGQTTPAYNTVGNALGHVFIPTLGGLSISVTGAATIAIDDVMVLEGDAGTTNAIFSVSLSDQSSQPVVLDYVTVNGTATAGIDYDNSFGSLTFQPGQTTKFIVVPIHGDANQEADETFVVRIANASLGTIVDGNGQVTILNDDALATVDSVVINDGSAQRSNVNRIAVRFSTDVTLLAGAFHLLDAHGSFITTGLTSSVIGGQTVAVLTFTGANVIGGSLPDGSYTLTIDSTKVLDGLGKALDGDDDGINGGNRVDAFFRLYGDSDGDGDVDKADRDLFRHAFDTQLGHPFYFDFFDFDGDGDIDQRDRREFNNLFTMK